eukprot:m51a1_g530 hypothetical protein (479) ;mRNA; f:370745-372398
MERGTSCACDDAHAAAQSVASLLVDWQNSLPTFPRPLELLLRETHWLCSELCRCRDSLPADLAVPVSEAAGGVERRLRQMRSRAGVVWCLERGWAVAELCQVRTDVRRLCEAVAAAVAAQSAGPDGSAPVSADSALLACKGVPGAADLWESVAGSLAWELDMDGSGTIGALDYSRWCAVEGRTPADWAREWQRPRQRVLCVDDRPTFVASLAQRAGPAVVIVPSENTDDASAILKKGADEFAMVVTNMVREEKKFMCTDTQVNPSAGIDLATRIRRDLHEDIAVVLYDEDVGRNEMLYEICVSKGATSVVGDIAGFLETCTVVLDPMGLSNVKYKRPEVVRKKAVKDVAPPPEQAVPSMSSVSSLESQSGQAQGPLRREDLNKSRARTHHGKRSPDWRSQCPPSVQVTSPQEQTKLPPIQQGRRQSFQCLGSPIKRVPSSPSIQRVPSTSQITMEFVRSPAQTIDPHLANHNNTSFAL